MRRRITRVRWFVPGLLAASLWAGERHEAAGWLDDLPVLRAGESHRISSADPSGGNHDRWTIPVGREITIAEIDGPAVIRHIWFTVRADDPDYLDSLRLRAFWNGALEPAVDVPLGDFFCLGHGYVEDVESIPICVNRAPHVPAPPGQAAFNCYFPMPFHRSARLAVENRGSRDLEAFYFHIDYETLPDPDPNLLLFHARYREEETVPDADTGTNAGGAGNYVILDATGEGHYVGCNLSVVSRPGQPGKWWEGDDMIWIDGEKWPSRIMGTGTEDYFSSAWGVRRPFCMPHSGVSVFQRGLDEGERYYDGRFTCYRFHLADPLIFRNRIGVTIEHGHGNDAGNAYSSVAYYYMKR
jgi:hypothetical protein